MRQVARRRDRPLTSLPLEEELSRPSSGPAASGQIDLGRRRSPGRQNGTDSLHELEADLGHLADLEPSPQRPSLPRDRKRPERREAQPIASTAGHQLRPDSIEVSLHRLVFRSRDVRQANDRRSRIPPEGFSNRRQEIVPPSVPVVMTN